MGFTSKQDWFSLFSQGAQPRVTNSRRKKSSALLLSLVVVFHSVIIFLMLNSKAIQRSNLSYQKPLQLLQLQPERKIISNQIGLQSLNIHAPEIRLTLPETIKDNKSLEFSESDLRGLPSEDTYELPSKNAHLYNDVFDPRLRKQLQENHQVVSKAKRAKLRTWQDVAGNTVVEVADGSCIRSMPSIGNSRETNWSLLRFKCGKNEGERMMDNVNADLAARKNKP